jgi:tetratricopeptide (TPR) repeat protein
MTRIAPSLFAAILALVAAAPSNAAPGLPAGAYLAARQASMTNDFAAAAEQYARILNTDADNPFFLENAVIAEIAIGDMTRAAVLADRLAATETESQIGALAQLADHATSGDFAAILDELDRGRRYAPLVDDLIRAWALIGAGQSEAALTAFGTPPNGFRLYNKALAQALQDDPAAALATLEAAQSATRDALVARAQLLVWLDRAAEGRALLDDALEQGDDATLRALRDQIDAGQAVGFDIVESAAEGMAGVFRAVAIATAERTPGTDALVYARIAQALDPGDPDTALLIAELLEDIGRFDLAIEAYRSVPTSAPVFPRAEIGRASVLYASDRSDAAVEVLSGLIRAYPELSDAHAAMASLLRTLERFDEAVVAYDAALRYHPRPDAISWGLYFARGTAHERAGNWTEAEADFRRALDLEPGQPDVLNYLGYSLVERREKLDEALGMIETAVAAEPQNGAIVDSLGWALYRLGRFDEAVGPMERAAELEPTDPVVNDHLGDVYWMVGRTREARFQWHRALSFDPEPAEAARIRAKLESGLDAVLAEEAVATGANAAND